MPPFLLHDIMPKIEGPWLLVVLLLMLLWFIVPKSIAACAILGALVVVRGDRIDMLPARLREALRTAPRPSIRLCLVALTLCVVAGGLFVHDAEFGIIVAMLSPLPFASDPPQDVGDGVAFLLLTIAAAAYWVLVVTGFRAALPLLRRRRAPRAAG